MISLTVNNKIVRVAPGTTVATAVFESGAGAFRRSVNGEKRFPLCGMGICFECRVVIDGIDHQRSCLIAVREGMKIETAEKD